jgi:hypothetical protein
MSGSFCRKESASAEYSLFYRIQSHSTELGNYSAEKDQFCRIRNNSAE